MTQMIESKLDPWPVQALVATLGWAAPGAGDATGDLGAGALAADAPAAGVPAELPPLWHWLYFLPTAPRSAIGPDGHMINQEWVDSTLRRRRLFAAARTEFIRPLRIGARAEMQERVLGRRDKRGRHGPFQILTLEYQYFQDGALCVREERDIVYLQGPAPAERAAEGEAAHDTAAADSWAMTLTPDPVMLMRFSALTFNSHLIHFDQLYTQREEGYPERVVHGPLVAIMLAQLLSLNGVRRITRFEFKARSPLFVNQPIQLLGRPEIDRVELRATGPSGVLAMQATARLSDPAPTPAPAT
jgi:3-methylfumaryl-CoA hydratase